MTVRELIKEIMSDNLLDLDLEIFVKDEYRDNDYYLYDLKKDIVIGEKRKTTGINYKRMR